jgi:hypothetical protein
VSHPAGPFYLCRIKHKHYEKMKPITIILVTVLTISVNLLFAGTEGATVNRNNHAATISLAPVTPAEATFEDSSETIDIQSLAPVSPAEADFNSDEDPMVSIRTLDPVTPANADFSDGN